MFWAWVQGCLGRPDAGLDAARTALRLHPHHPRWYDTFLARLLFLLRRYEQAAGLFEQANSTSPSRRLRDIGWHAACCGHLGRDEEARQRGRQFIEMAEVLWLGEAGAGPTQYVDWLVDVSFLQRDIDRENLRDGLHRAGLTE